MNGSTWRTLTLALLVALALAAGNRVSHAADEGTPPGSLRFEGSNLLTTAHGSFHQWRFRRIDVDPEHPERSVVEVEVDVASLDTGIGRRNDHLRSADFFDVARFPTAFVRVSDAVSDGTSADGHPRYRAKFDVRIRGVEKTLDGHFEVLGTSPLKVEGELLLDRVEFGVGEPHSRWNPLSVQDEVPVHFSAVIPLPGAPADGSRSEP